MSVFFKAPVLSARGAALNVVGSQTSGSLSVIGLNFVFTDHTPSGRVGTAECATSSWASSTSVYCVAEVKDPFVVTVGGVVGTMTLSFTYDAPVVSFTRAQNIAITDGGIVTVSGVNFRTSDMTNSNAISDNLCNTAAWASKTSVICNFYAATSTGPRKDIVVTANSIVGTRTQRFTFDGNVSRVCFS